MDTARAGAAAGHRNSAFEIWALPEYQHFRPSISRHDQCPPWEGAATRHSRTCAAGATVGSSDTMATARKAAWSCPFIEFPLR
jgi:hypothetical protein